MDTKDAGRIGGKLGGRRNTEAQRAARLINMRKALENRWPKAAPKKDRPAKVRADLPQEPRVSDPKHELPMNALYGINTVNEALHARPVDYVMVTQGSSNPRLQEIIDTCRATGIAVRFAPRPALDRAAGTPHHQNVVAFCTPKAYDDLEAIVAATERPLLVVLDGVEDPANLGAIVRTVVAAGSHGVVIPARRAAGLSPAVARSAAGALEHARIARVTNLVQALTELKERGVWVYGFEAQASKSYLELDYTGACALVFGGEGHGVHRLVRETCDELACIPLHGPVQSLNVSVATAVVLYEAARQRHPG